MLNKVKKALFLILGSAVVGSALLLPIQYFLSLKQIRLSSNVAALSMIPGFFISLWLWKALPRIWEKLKLWAQNNYDRSRGNDSVSKGKRVLFLLVAFAYLYYQLARALMAFANWYMHRGEGIMQHNYDTLTPAGMIGVGVAAALLTWLFWLVMNKSELCRAIAAVVSLVCVVNTVAIFLDVKGISASWAQVREALITGAVIGEIIPISLPDWGVVLGAAPALVLAYYGEDSPLAKLARVCKFAAFGLIVLSATAVCTFARIGVWKIFH